MEEASEGRCDCCAELGRTSATMVTASGVAEAAAPSIPLPEGILMVRVPPAALPVSAPRIEAKFSLLTILFGNWACPCGWCC